jgi:hypothetical protein
MSHSDAGQIALTKKRLPLQPQQRCKPPVAGISRSGGIYGGIWAPNENARREAGRFD